MLVDSNVLSLLEQATNMVNAVSVWVLILTSCIPVVLSSPEAEIETICAPYSNKNNDSASLDIQKGLLNLMTFLQAKLAAQEAKMAALEAKLEAQEAKAASCDKWRQEQEVRDMFLKEKMEDIRKEVIERESNVSFLAIHPIEQRVPPHGIVKFTTVRHNTAPQHFGYDPKISHFRCPVTGVYSFSFGTTSAGGDCGSFAIAIKRDQAVLVLAHQRSGPNTHSDCVEVITATAVSPCRQGEYVYVQSIQSNAGNLWSDSNGVTYFTGFKIY